MSDPEFLATTDGRHIAYHKREAQGPREGPGVVFFGGFKSDMTGSKAVFLEETCAELGLSCLRFDYTGHGQSSGTFEAGCIGDWLRDARDAVEALTEGPQIYVGSSMGGWIALLLAREAPERVAGFIGIAAAPDFTEDSMWAAASAIQRRQISEQGFVAIPSEYDKPYVITRRLIEEGREHLLLRAPYHAPFPVRLLHGSADLDVPQERALRLMSHLQGPDVSLTLLRGSDHRMSEPRELSQLKETLLGLVAVASPSDVSNRDR